MAAAKERKLIEQVQRGDLDAYGEIIRAYQTSVFNVCIRILGNVQEAEDLAQEVFLRAYRNISQYDPSRPFGPWVRVLAANLCYNHLKKARLNWVELEDERGHPDHGSRRGPEEWLEISQANQDLYQQIWQLPENQRVALELRHFQGLSYKEMATAMNLPLNTVRSHLYRARRTLAERMAAEEQDE
jgi:RNA polymerase sigma-70 factor (ECF subfamily)